MKQHLKRIKMHHLHAYYSKIFCGGGLALSPDPSPAEEGDTWGGGHLHPLSDTTPIVAGPTFNLTHSTPLSLPSVNNAHSRCQNV